MIFGSAENKCMIDILNILNQDKSKYSNLFKITKVSHTTLQKVLRELLVEEFISKHNEGYEITGKGRRFLEKLEELRKFLS